MRIIIQKFGGTSVADDEGRSAAAQRIASALHEGIHPVVVVSAMGRRGDAYATDTLLDLVHSVHPDADPRERDLLASCGEVISAVMMVQTLKRHGIRAAALTGGQAGIVTDENFTNARVLHVDPQRILRHLERGEVAVTAGFQGVSENGEITTLGRGGSDTTAAALGAALVAERVEIYTDVGGIYTADPRIVPGARNLQTVTYEEIAQMAVEGARVIHPRAVEIAMRANVPVHVRSTFSAERGTLITHTWRRDRTAPLLDGRVVTGIAHIPGLVLCIIRNPAAGSLENGRSGRSDRRIFRALADAGISVDMINVSLERKAFVVQQEFAEPTRRLLEGLGFSVEMRDHCTKVTVIGTGMRGLPGVMARIVEALDRAGVGILLSVDSHITISCLVREADTKRSVRALHDAFHTGIECTDGDH